MNQSKKGKILEDSFWLFFDLVKKLIQIFERFETVVHPILSILHQNIQDFAETIFEMETMTLGEIYHLLLYLKEDISRIQNDLGIVGYTISEISGLEADKNAKAYLQKFRRSLRKCSKCGNTEIHQ